MDFGWITFAVDDSSVRNVLVLLNSLRSVHTSHKIVVIVGLNVSAENIGRIHQLTGYVTDLKTNLGLEGNSDVAARLQCWAIPGFTRLIFLDARCVVLGNVDDLFKKVEDGVVAVSHVERGLSRAGIECPVIVLEPSFLFYQFALEKLRGAPSTSGCGDMWECFHSFLKTRTNFRTMTVEDNVYVGDQQEDSRYRGLLKWISTQDVDDGKQTAGRTETAGTVGKDISRSRLQGAEPIAIVGVSCRFPDSNSTEEFWELLINGENAIRPQPLNRWTAEQGCVVEDTDVQVGWLKCPVDEVDASFFGFNPMELKYTDPQQRLLLEVAYEALEDAGISAQKLRNRRVGVFTASWKDDYKELMIETGFKGTEFFRSFMGNSYSASSARLSHILGVTGPNIVSESGCSASFSAVRQGVTALRTGDAEISIASAVNLILHPFKFVDMKAVVSPDSRCKTFDASANGLARAEGVASLVLKRLSDAVRSGDRIYGLIRGMGMTQDGNSTSMGTPTVECEALAMQMALKEAQVNPVDVDYIEAHGTGTAVGDPIEVRAITKAYAGAREKPLLIGSVKTNIGHTEAASGMASIIKILLAFKHEVLPPHKNVTTLNPDIDFSCIPAELVIESTPWKKTLNRKRIAGISNFGISGGDMHMILEEPPSQPYRRNTFTFPSPPTKLLTISAKSVKALNLGLRRLEDELNSNRSLNLDDVAYTLNTGRSHYEHRVAIAAKDTASVAKAIAEGTYASTPRDWVPKTMTRIGFLFPGQYTEYAGMGQELAQISPVFRHHFDHCSQIVQQEHGLNLKDALWSKNDLVSPLLTQVAIFVVEYAMAQLWAHWGVIPDVVVGHSLGEFVAAVVAKVMSLNDAITLVVSRYRLVERLPKGGMAVVFMDSPATGTMLKNFKSSSGHSMDIAAINSTSQTAVSGSMKAIADLVAHCSTIGVTVTQLNSTVGYHSALLEPILAEFESLATKLTYSKPCCTFISSATGIPETEFGAKYWVRQTRNCVQFLQSCSTLVELADVFIEVGPQPTLIPLLLTNVNGINPVCVPSMERKACAWGTLSKSLAKLYTSGVDIDWDAFHKFLPGEKVALPFYAFQRKKFWFNAECGSMIPTSRRLESGKNEFPLLGCQLFTPLDSHLIYVNHLSLKSVPYVAHHKIGEYAVFPGAGYVEMFLEAASKLGYPSVVRNIRFLAPLVLTNDGSQETHTVFWRESSKVKIFCRPSNIAPWICQSEAELCATSEQAKHSSKEALSAIFTDENLSTSTDTTHELYTRLRGQGYNFGIKFQTIQRISAGPRGTFLVEIAVPPIEENGHVCHPIVIDSVMQSIAFTYTDFSELQLPSGINHFEIVSSPRFIPKYVHVTPMEVLLIDEAMTVVGVMKGMETLPSTLGRIKNSLHQYVEATTTPLFEEHWVVGQTPASFNNHFSDIMTQKDVTFVEAGAKFGTDTAEILALKEGIGKGIMIAFKQLGWDAFSIGAILTADVVIQQFDLIKVSPSHKIVNRLLEMLEEEGILKTEGHNSFKVLELLPTMEQLIREEKSCRLRSSHLLKEWELSTLYLKNLVPILKGRVSALELLFPSSGSSSTSAENFYVEANSSKELNTSLQATFSSLIAKSSSVWEIEKEIHVLEIGAGTGSATSYLLPLLEKAGIRFNYTYTDISSAYFRKAEIKFAKWKKSMTFKTFNVEECPEGQGFPPNYYHLVVASNVLHATVDLVQTLDHTRQLLRQYGLLVLAETFIPQRHYDISVGHLDGYWRYKDFELRPSHCIVSQDIWHRILTGAGFKVVTSTTVYDGGLGVICAEYNVGKAIVKNGVNNSWILFSDGSPLAKFIHDALAFQGRHVLEVSVAQNLTTAMGVVSINTGSKSDVNKVFESVERLEGVVYMYGTIDTLGVGDVWKCYLFIIQELAGRYPNPSHVVKTPKLAVITRGIFRLGDQTPVFPGAAPLSGMTRSFLTEFPHFTAKLIDLDPDDSNQVTPLKSADVISSLLWSPTQDSSKRVLIALRAGLVYHARLRRFLTEETIYPPLALPEKPFCLKLSETNKVADLTFTVFTPPEILCADEVEIKVRAIGLNFRDILLVFKGVEQKSVAAGCDVSGIVKRVGGKVKKFKAGDAVFGARSSPISFPSVAIMREDELMMLPDTVTFEEGVTYPIAFASAYYSLVMLANLQKGENVLIHTATGGVGLHLVQLAFAVGARVFATAGSRRKRAYLEYIGVKPEHIFSSRDASFKDKILALGDGLPMIDMVINSITGPGLKEASLAVCRERAKFVELSKMNVWSIEEVKALRPDVTYYIVDLSDSTTLSDVWGTIMEELATRINSRTCSLKPLPVTYFQAESIRDAMTYMQKAKHIGKIVCGFPISEGSKQSPLFNDRSLYLIVGGLGGIGLQVAEWMISKGAKHIALTGRTSPSKIALSSIHALNEGGGTVFWAQLDVSSYQEVSKLILKLASQTELPTLRGVMNCAGSLSDGGILEQNQQKYDTVLGSKVTGSLNLHILTKHLPLEHFVMFSSFAAVIGSPGQSNHAAANAFQDALAVYRHNSGLPGTSVNWGQWGEAGVAIGQKIHGHKPMSTAACLASLHKVLRSHIPHAIAADGIHTVWKSLAPWTETYFQMLDDEKNVAKPIVKVEKKDATESFWEELKCADGMEEMTSVVRSYILNVLAKLLDQSPDEIPLDQDLRLDSLMKIELRNSLQSLVGASTVVPNTLGSSLQHMTEKVLEVTMGNGNQGNVANGTRTDGGSSKPSFSKLVRDEVTLALEAWKIFKPEIYPKLSVSQIRTALLTGVTGNFGPYVLSQLTQRPNIQVVYCLVQASDENEGLKRVKLALQRVELLPKVDMTKVKVVIGTLARPRFGVSDSIYQKLASSVDAVFNIAAATSHMEEYKVNAGNYVRQVNVLGVREVLLFATTGQAKYVYQASSIATIMKSTAGAGGKRVMQEGWATDDEFDNAPNFGYIVSKFVGDKLVEGFLRQVGRLPVKVFRFPLFTGCSTSGAQDVFRNHFFLKYLYYIKSGVMPRDDVPIPLLPVDICSAISLHIFFNEDAPSDVYNITNPNAPSELELPKLASIMGWGDIRIVDYDVWAKMLKEDKNCLLGSLKEFYTDPGRYPKLKMEMEVLNAWRNNKNGFYRCSMVEKYAPKLMLLVEDSMVTLQRDIEYALKMVK